MTPQPLPFFASMLDLLGLAVCGATLVAVAVCALRGRRAGVRGQTNPAEGEFTEALNRHLKNAVQVGAGADPGPERPKTPPAAGPDMPAKTAAEADPLRQTSRFDAVARLSDRGLGIREISEKLKIPREEIGLYLCCTAGRGHARPRVH